MGFWGRLFRKSSPAPIWRQLAQQPRARRGVAATLRTYETNGWIRAISDLVAFEVAMARLYALKPTVGSLVLERRWHNRKAQVKSLIAQRKAIKLETHEVLSILRSPSKTMSGLAALKLIQLHLDLAGEAFLWLTRDAGRVVGFEVVSPAAVVSVESGAITVAVEGGNITLADTEFVHLKHCSPVDPSARGSGLGGALGRDLQVGEHVSDSLNSVFARGGLPTTLVSVSAADQNQDATDIAEDLQKRFDGGLVGPDRQGQIHVLPGRISTAIVNPDLKQLEVVEIGHELRNLIRQVFCVPPEIIGDLSSSNRSTSEAAEYHLQSHAVLPRLEFLVAELNHKLCPLVDSSVVLDFEDPRPSQSDLSVSLMTNGNTAHSFTQNEVRALAGLDPIEGGDARLLPPPGAKPISGVNNEPS